MTYNELYNSIQEFSVGNMLPQVPISGNTISKSSTDESTNIKRSELDDNVFGIPEQRKYPMPDKKHVLSAIKFFNYVDKEYEEELANNILSNMEKYNISTDRIGEKNRLKKYVTESTNNIASEFFKRATRSVVENVNESTQKSILDKGFKKKEGINFDFIEIHGNNVNKYLNQSSYCKKYIDVIHKSKGEIAIDKNNDKIAGYIFVNNDKEKGFIWTLEVLEKYKGYGVGERLLKDAISKLGAVDLVCYKDNEVALNLYKKYGFVNIGYGNTKDKSDYWMKLKSKLTNEERKKVFTENINNKESINAIKLKIYDAYYENKINNDEKDGLLSNLQNKSSKYENDKFEVNEETAEEFASKKHLKRILNLYKGNTSQLNKEVEKYEKLIEYCEHEKEKAPEKISMKTLMKKGHQNGLRSAGISAIAGQNGLNALLATQKNTGLRTKKGWINLVNDLTKYMNILKDNI